MKIEFNLSKKREIEVVEIENTDLVRFSDKCITIQGETVIDTQVHSGITHKDNVKVITADQDIDDRIDFAGRKLYAAALRKADYDRCMTENAVDVSLDNILIYKEVDQYLENDNYMVVLYDGRHNAIMDLNFRYISLPIHFNYRFGYITNYSYDLDGLLAILKKDEHVLNRDSLEITRIPLDFYREIDFLYLLSDEEYNNIMPQNTNSKGFYEYILNNMIGVDSVRKDEE